jgi:hypothetical protein
MPPSTAEDRKPARSAGGRAKSSGRERLKRLLHKRATGEVSWSALVCKASLDALPSGLRGMTALDFYRHIGCDILHLHFQNSCCTLVMPGVEESASWDEQGVRARTIRSPRGALTARWGRGGHPIEYPVKTLEDIRLYRGLWESARYESKDDAARTLADVEGRIEEDGVAALFPGPSAIPHLLEEAMGVEAFYYAMCDHPEEMAGLVRTIQEKDHERFELIAELPCDVAILCENTSTRYISPAVYEQFNLPSQRDFVEVMHAAGKVAILHMCGHVRGLLPLIRQTGTDGIHALTPPPLGDCPWEEALDELGEDCVILAALPVSEWLQPPLGEVKARLDRLIAPRLVKANFLPIAFADGIAVPAERFLAIRDWAESCRGT